MSKTFGEKLKELRIEKGMSQEELAIYLGTSKQVVSRYETNQRTPKITTAIEYANKLNVPLLYLLDDSKLHVEKELVSSKNDELDPLIDKAMKILSSLSPDLRKIALEQLDSLAKVQDKE